MNDERCENCKFWKPDSNTEPPGYCRRYPPVLLTPVVTEQVKEARKNHKIRDIVDFAANEMHESANWDFPRTDADSWCGEWKPKP